MITGHLHAVGRLSTQTFNDFPALSHRLVFLQGEIEKIRLRDGPTMQSTAQMTLVAQLRRAQKEYVRHQRRNEWATEIVKTEFELFAKRHVDELVHVMQDTAKFLQK